MVFCANAWDKACVVRYTRLHKLWSERTATDNSSASVKPGPTEQKAEEEEEEEEAIPERPPVPVDDKTPGFVGINFLDPSPASNENDTSGVSSIGGQEDLPPVPTRRSRPNQ